MKFLFGFLFLVNTSAMGQKSTEVDSLRRELHSRFKESQFKIIETNNGIETRFQFFKSDSTLDYVKTLRSPWRTCDTVVNYRFLNKKLVSINIGFKKIYIVMWFKDGLLIDKVERRGWRVIDVQSYLDQGYALRERAANLLHP
jgi:hypothetical protein